MCKDLSWWEVENASQVLDTPVLSFIERVHVSTVCHFAFGTNFIWKGSPLAWNYNLVHSSEHLYGALSNLHGCDISLMFEMNHLETKCMF